jgi:hypothetical protein
LDVFQIDTIEIILPHINPTIGIARVGEDRLVDDHFIGQTVVQNIIQRALAGGMHNGDADVN